MVSLTLYYICVSRGYEVGNAPEISHSCCLRSLVGLTVRTALESGTGYIVNSAAFTGDIGISNIKKE